MRPRTDIHARVRSIPLGRGDLASFRLRQFEGFSYPDPQAPTEVAHRHEFQELLWIESGSGRQIIDGTVGAIEPRTCYIVVRGQVHQFLEARNLHGLMLCFTDDFLPGAAPGRRASGARPLFDPLRAPHALPLDAEQAARCRSIVDQIRRENELPGDAHKARILGHLLETLLALLERSVRNGAPPEGGPAGAPARLCAEFAGLLEQHYATRHDAAFYARMLRVSAHALVQSTRLVLGKTPKQLIEERLFLEAKRYLRFTTLPVKEISHALGFEDASYFSRSFRRLGGTSPQDFRGR